MQSVAEKVYDEVLGSSRGRRFTVPELASRLNESPSAVAAAVRRLTEDDMLTVVGKDFKGSRPQAIYEVTGRLVERKFHRRPARAKVEPKPQQPATGPLTEEELDLLALELLQRVPDDALQAELARRARPTNGHHLPPRVAAILGAGV